MKRFLTLLMAINAGFAWAQTNAPVRAVPEKAVPATNDLDQFTDINSVSFHYDGNQHEVVYQGHVVVVDAKSELHCGQLTVKMPADGGRPTNAVALTNVVIDMLDDKGQTNHITADKAVYNYSVVNGLTNEVVTFIGGNPSPEVQNPQYTIWADPLILDMATKQYTGTNEHMIFKESPKAAKGTNAPAKIF